MRIILLLTLAASAVHLNCAQSAFMLTSSGQLTETGHAQDPKAQFMTANEKPAFANAEIANSIQADKLGEAEASKLRYDAPTEGVILHATR